MDALRLLTQIPPPQFRDEFRFDEISVICGNEAASSDESGILRVPEQPPQLALKKVHVIFLSF